MTHAHDLLRDCIDLLESQLAYRTEFVMTRDTAESLVSDLRMARDDLSRTVSSGFLRKAR